MPTYEYECKKCKHQWELDQGIKEEPATECPQCHQQEAQRNISAPNFILKGRGWASEGYGS